MPDNGAARTEMWRYHEGRMYKRWRKKHRRREERFGRRRRDRQGDRGLHTPKSSLFFGKGNLVPMRATEKNGSIKSEPPWRKAKKTNRGEGVSRGPRRQVHQVQFARLRKPPHTHWIDLQSSNTLQRTQQRLRQNACVGTLSVSSRAFQKNCNLSVAFSPS